MFGDHFDYDQRFDPAVSLELGYCYGFVHCCGLENVNDLENRFAVAIIVNSTH